MYKKVNKIRRKYGISNKSSADDLISVLHKMNCNVSVYSEERMKLAALKLTKISKKSPALSVGDSHGNVTVYYDSTNTESVLQIALAHEIGHIYLGHLEAKKSKAQEDAANQFARLLLAPVDIIGNILKLVMMVLILFITVLSVPNNKPINVTAASETSAESSFETQNFGSADSESVSDYANVSSSVPKVAAHTSSSTELPKFLITDSTECYITPHGTVFHIDQGCYYLDNSYSISIKTYTDCKDMRLCSACSNRYDIMIAE